VRDGPGGRLHASLQLTEAALDSHEAFIDSAKPAAGGVDIPLPVIDFLQADVFSDQHVADVGPHVAPSDDLIKGSRNGSAVGTLIERASCHVMLDKLDGCDAQSVLERFTIQPRTLPATLSKTLTYDQGAEMVLHETLAKRPQMDSYFCDRASPWQRAANKNANGHIPEYLPTGSDLSTVTNAELRAIEARLSGRPRQMLRFQTPNEVFSSFQLNEFIHVALRA
jgi:hypothetical protein